MASQRTVQRIACLKSYVLSKVCAQPDCRRKPAAGHNLCIIHRDHKKRYGLPTANPISPLQRRSYVRGFLTVIRKELRKARPSSLRRGKSRDSLRVHRQQQAACNIALISAVNELDSFLVNQCPFISMSDITNKGLGADRKLRAILKNVHRRWPQPNRAAVNILASVCGAWLAVEIEGDENAKHHPRYRQAAIFAAIFSLVRTPSVKRIIERNGKPVVVMSRHRPWITGRRIHEAMDKHITQKLARYIFESKAARKAVLELILKHDYSRHYWA